MSYLTRLAVKSHFSPQVFYKKSPELVPQFSRHLPPSWIFNYYTVSHSVIIVRGDIILSSNDFCTDFLHKIYVKKRFQWYCLSFVVLINLELCLFVFFSVCFQIKGTKQSQAFQFSDRTQQHYEVGLFCLSMWINPRVYIIWMCAVIIL